MDPAGQTGRVLALVALAMQTALLVEDDADIRALIADLLREQGFDRVLDAADSKEAHALAATNRLDLVVLDQNLGQDSGIEVAEQLRTVPGFRAPILVTTALPQHQAEQLCAEAGACECVSKPFDITIFIEAVQACLDGQGPAVAA